jgi:hypothetical protein
MLAFKEFLAEAKFDNNLDIKDIIAFAKQHESKIMDSQTETSLEAYEHFKSVIKLNPKVYVFAKSIAYRMGRSSIKSITGFKDGFKASFGKDKSSESLLDPAVYTSNSKIGTVAKFALLIAARHPEFIASEDDKTEKQETEETIRTVQAIKALLQDMEEDHIRIIIGSKEFKVDGFRQIDGRPKADMAFTYKGRDQIFVSHKLGSKPADFQQYGGIVNDLGYLKNSRKSNIVKGASHEYINGFLSSIDSILSTVYNVKSDKNGIFSFKDVKKGTNFAIPISDNNIAGLVMFGKNYNSGKLGLDNVHILVDGNIILDSVGKGNAYVIKGSYHTMINPTIPGSKDRFPTKAPYQPMLFVMRSASQGLNQGGFLNARVVIWPRNSITNNYYTKYKSDLAKAKKGEYYGPI